MRLSLGEAYGQAKKMLRAAMNDQPLATPDLDARLLIAHACQIPDYRVLTDQTCQLDKEQQEKIQALLERRCSGEPVARIMGEKLFWGLPFKVNAHTLVPRPETEGLVEEILRWIDHRGMRQGPLKILDLGVGSGAILVSLLSELENAQGIAVDISFEALTIAVENAISAGVSNRFLPVVSDYGAAIKGDFDIVVSNPPYIAWSERESLMRDVRDFDPEGALFAGNKGLDAYHSIFPWAFENLKEQGFAIVEHGYGQAKAVAEIARQSGFKRIECTLDLSSLPRFTKLHRC